MESHAAKLSWVGSGLVENSGREADLGSGEVFSFQSRSMETVNIDGVP